MFRDTFVCIWRIFRWDRIYLLSILAIPSILLIVSIRGANDFSYRYDFYRHDVLLSYLDRNRNRLRRLRNPDRNFDVVDDHDEDNDANVRNDRDDF